MRRISVFVLFLFTLQPLAAQSKDSLRLEKKTGLVFFFDGAHLFGGFGGKYWINGQQFLRSTIYGWYNTQKGPSDARSNLVESKSVDVNVTLDFANRFGAVEDLIPYWGASLGVSRHLTEETWRDPTDTWQATYDRIGFGVGAFIGVEYFITSRVSLSGEQRIFVSFGWGKQYEKTFRVNNSTSTLLLSVYL